MYENYIYFYRCGILADMYSEFYRAIECTALFFYNSYQRYTQDIYKTFTDIYKNLMKIHSIIQ
jgi:hypothetical protein